MKHSHICNMPTTSDFFLFSQAIVNMDYVMKSLSTPLFHIWGGVVAVGRGGRGRDERVS
jgi:hypothetical protein